MCLGAINEHRTIKPVTAIWTTLRRHVSQTRPTSVTAVGDLSSTRTKDLNLY